MMAQSFVSRLRPRGRAQSARVPESDGTPARAVCRTSGIRSHRCLYACWRGRSMGQIFEHREGGESEPAAAHSLNGCGRAMAQQRGQFAGPWVSGHTDACTHIGAGGRRNRFRASRSGGGSVRDAAHGLGEWPRAMARRRRLLPDLRISAPSVVARILVWACDATDFRPSINGAGGACASRRMVWGSV